MHSFKKERGEKSERKQTSSKKKKNKEKISRENIIFFFFFFCHCSRTGETGICFKVSWQKWGKNSLLENELLDYHREGKGGNWEKNLFHDWCKYLEV